MEHTIIKVESSNIPRENSVGYVEVHKMLFLQTFHNNSELNMHLLLTASNPFTQFIISLIQKSTALRTKKSKASSAESHGKRPSFELIWLYRAYILDNLSACGLSKLLIEISFRYEVLNLQPWVNQEYYS